MYLKKDPQRAFISLNRHSEKASLEQQAGVYEFCIWRPQSALCRPKLTQMFSAIKREW
jgi:hypothetical protein